MVSFLGINRAASLWVRLTGRALLPLLLVGLLSGETWVLGSACDCSKYTITFLGATFDGTNTTFSYRVCSNGSPAISHWVLGLPTTCAGCADIVAASHSYVCGTDPTTHLFGVKFDQGFTTPQCRDYWITLRGYWPTGEITVAVKAGTDKCYYTVQGPACPPPGQPGLVLEKKTNGVDADTLPGPVVVAGSTVTWTYEVTNTGNVTLTDIVVTDDQVGSIGTIPSLAPGASATLTKTGTAVTGQYENRGTATTTYSGQTVSDTDPSHYFGAAPAIDIEKLVSVDGGATWVDADTATGPYALAGSTVKFKVVVTNTGNVALTSVGVTDTDFTFAGVVTSLAVGASDESDVLSVTAVVGQHENEATASGTPPVGAAVSDKDKAHYFGAAPSIDLVKTGTLNLGPNGQADAGDTISYTFAVTNTGNVPLTNVTVADPKVTVVGGPIASLAAGATDTTTFTGTYVLTQADIDAGTFTNTATATGTPPSGPNVSDSDSDTQTLVGVPSIDIEKHTNGVDADSPTGPVVLVGSSVTWTYEVTNTGNVTLTDIVVTDDQAGSIGTIPTLAPGASATLTKTGTAVAGQYANIGTATTTYSGQTVSDTDPSHYFGAQPGLVLEKKTNGVDADTLPGPVVVAGSTVTWTYEVTNTGNVPLTNIAVTDDQVGSIGTIPSLDVGATATLTKTGTAVAGQYENRGTATTTYSGETVSDTDPSHYFGAAPAIDIEKLVSVDGGATWV
ncbi:hypothetical protein H5T54_07400, partial [Candidatus Bipolaricaulota bacterium]|nr:hypothetical protein [Candidatus Bipolaricaulota bacterium]